MIYQFLLSDFGDFFKMPLIISKDRFESQRQQMTDRYFDLSEKHQDDLRWKKLARNFKRMEKCYSAKKVLTIKTLRFFEKYQMIFKEEQRALIVRVIELLRKLLWHKKLNRED